MIALPHHRPHNLSLGPLEAEILNILWDLEQGTVREIHDQILSDPDRELAYASVTTVLNRLVKKGWIHCDRTSSAFQWQPRITRTEAQVLLAYQRLQGFLAVGHPDIVAALIDSLDEVSLEQLDIISDQIRAARRARDV